MVKNKVVNKWLLESKKYFVLGLREQGSEEYSFWQVSGLTTLNVGVGVHHYPTYEKAEEALERFKEYLKKNEYYASEIKTARIFEVCDETTHTITISSASKKMQEVETKLIKE